MKTGAVLASRSPDGVDLADGPAPVIATGRPRFWRRLLRHRMALASMLVLAVLIVACFGAPWLAPYKQNAQAFPSFAGPSARHWFGTDQLGNDQLTETMYAGRISLGIGLVVALLSTVLGVSVGAVAAYYGHRIDQLLSAIIDLFLILPGLALLGVAVSALGPNFRSIVLVLAALSWMGMARMVRAQVLSLKEREFVEAARASGASTARILVRHIVPNCSGTIMVNATLAIAGAISTEAGLSFLGLGVQPPQRSWGSMLYGGEMYAASATRFYLVLFPALALLFTVLAVSFLGDALRDALGPRSRH